MKFLLSLVTCTLLLALVTGGMFPVRKSKSQTVITKQVIKPFGQQQLGLDKCKVCLDFSEQALNILLNEILQGVVVGGCSALCQALANKINSTVIGEVCDVLCSIVGIEEFVKIIEEADLDPIYYCELLKECPIFDSGDAKITKFEITPKSGPQGEFDISFEYVSVNGTGTGEIDLDVDTVDGIPLGQGFLHEIAPAGTYPGTFKLKAEPDPDCDPSQGPCEAWLPGDYTVKIALCNGECGSKHPHSQVYDEKSATFTITDQHL